MSRFYLIRLDDACPTMDSNKWSRIESILDTHKILPMVGVIPHNEDPNLVRDKENTSFWNLVHKWKNKGWAIAMHGYNHKYCSNQGMKGLNPMWARSEFSGLPLEDQERKIRDGISVFRANGINPEYFFAPSHTFDDNTLSALRKESDIRIISDTIATRPYKYNDFVIIPQFGGLCRSIGISGVFTFCFHPNTMKEEDFEKLDSFLHSHRDDFTSFSSLDLSVVARPRNIFDRFISSSYFFLRKLKGLQ